MKTNWIDWLAIAAICLVMSILAACTTDSARMLPRGDKKMVDIWAEETGGRGAKTDVPGVQGGVSVSPGMAGEVGFAGDDSNYTREAANEIRTIFKRLPNPDLVMYVYPHLAGNRTVPVPGYSTVFPFYRQTPYAMPGERIAEDR